MGIEITKLTAAQEADYEQLLAQSPHSMLYHSLQYRVFLKKICRDAADQYLLAYDNGKLVAALPVFIKPGPYGTVVNSLPFFGSHGSIIASNEATATSTHALLNSFERLCEQHSAVCSAIIGNPFSRGVELIEPYEADYTDDRIGQITLLPTDFECVDDALMASFHQKTRNSIRKGLKSGFLIGHENQADAVHDLCRIHEQNIRAMGGIPKAPDVFDAIISSFEYESDFRIYTARNRSGLIVSALLVFYYKGMVEYYTPATLEEYRSEQPLCALIYTAMRDSVLERGARYWNWGGTWLSQTGVYRFKSRWGTKDHPYRYYIREYPRKGRLLHLSQTELLAAYPYFYTIPFKELKAGGDTGNG